MPNEQEDSWRRDFELWGHDAVERTVGGTNEWDDPRRQFALRWLREKESGNERREQQTQQATRRMLWLGLTAIFIAAVSVFVSVIALLMW
jgi:hypothetical protein